MVIYSYGGNADFSGAI